MRVGYTFRPACNPGYKPATPILPITCQSNGVFSGSLPNCTGKLNQACCCCCCAVSHVQLPPAPTTSRAPALSAASAPQASMAPSPPSRRPHTTPWAAPPPRAPPTATVSTSLRDASATPDTRAPSTPRPRASATRDRACSPPAPTAPLAPCSSRDARALPPRRASSAPCLAPPSLSPHARKRSLVVREASWPSLGCATYQ